MAWCFVSKAHGARAAPSFCGQGSLEYLVIVGVVLVLALVSVALLGSVFEKDSEMTQQNLYWKSASPVAITDAVADDGEIRMNVKNNAQFPLKVTKIASGDEKLDSPDNSILQPGEERVLAVPYSSLSHTSSCKDSNAGTRSQCFVELASVGFTIEANYEGVILEKTQQGQDLFVQYERSPSCKGIVCDAINKVCCPSTGQCVFLGGHLESGGCPDWNCGGCGDWPPKMCCLETGLCYNPGIDPTYCLDECGGKCKPDVEKCCPEAGNVCILTELVCDSCGGKCDLETEYCVKETGECEHI